MLKKLLERRVGQLGNAEFKEVMKITEDDIKFNRISFNKCTNLSYVLDIAERATNILKSCA